MVEGFVPLQLPEVKELAVSIPLAGCRSLPLQLVPLVCAIRPGGFRPEACSFEFVQPPQDEPKGMARTDTSCSEAVGPERRPPGASGLPRVPEPVGEETPWAVLSTRDRLFLALLPSVHVWLRHRKLRLAAAPFPYQQQGIAFLVSRSAALLADEMGLGKTMQAIVACRLALAMGWVQEALLVCPKPLVSNWCREFERWAPDVPLVVIQGTQPRRQALWHTDRAAVRVANYEVLVRDADLLLNRSQPFDLVILDEAQRIKNPRSQTAQVVCRLPRRRSWALTGTPVENRMEDLVALFEFLQPKLLRPDLPPASVRAWTAPYVLRRTKEMVLDQLPPKVIRDTYIDLGPNQRRSYLQAEKKGILKLNELGESLRIGNVFQLILRLKQICNRDPVTGESSKLEQLKQDLWEATESGRKAVIFSQWVQTLEWLKTELQELEPLEFHGRVSPKERQRALEAFRKGSSSVLLISYGAGSVGLNLQCAQYLFLFDRWWNPAVEDQAIHRVHRIGQVHPVFVTRYVVKSTIEERIAFVLERKRALIGDLLPDRSSAPAPAGWTEEEIFQLLDMAPRRRAQAA
jgi:SNF2 family DNA or RNA helicase